MKAQQTANDRRRPSAPAAVSRSGKPRRAAAPVRPNGEGESAPAPVNATLDVGSDADRQILAEALSALLRERSSAWQIAARIAQARNRPSPDPREFGLTDILRLSRQLDPAAAQA